MRKKAQKPVVLCILDGWGDGPDTATNAITRGATPRYDEILAASPHAQLLTSAAAVGLPAGQMGNSEVGHQNLGAGRVVLQNLPRIDLATANGAFDEDEQILALAARLRDSGGTCHILGLLSPGGVHSHHDHMVALARAMSEQGVPVALHGFLDGRDTPPHSADDFIATVAAALPAGAWLATLCGRYFAMDRDRRWDRVSRAYDLLVAGQGARATDAAAAIKAAYDAGQSDEFVEPVTLAGYDGMVDGDGLIMANFRSDRAREILTALLDPDFDGFVRNRRVEFAGSLGMVSYSEALDRLLPALFAPRPLSNTLGEVLANAGMRQLRIAETEKYAHVTFFFNGGEEQIFAGEERILVPSPKVATYDLQPEMSASEVTDKLVAAIAGGTFDFIVVNYANADMVGHTGIMAAALKAVATLDHCLGRLAKAVNAVDGYLLITADHGNIEQMTEPGNGGKYTAHTINPVPIILHNADADITLRDGCLADVAPTILALLQLPQPVEMTGSALVKTPVEERKAPPGGEQGRQANV